MSESSRISKTFAVVGFSEENAIEVIPSSWIVDENTAKWPKGVPGHLVFKFIKECKATGFDSEKIRIKIYGYSDSFKKVQKKADRLLETSAISSDATDNDIPEVRKRKMPARFENCTMSDEEDSPSLLVNKKFCRPSLPNEELTEEARKRKMVPRFETCAIADGEDSPSNSINQRYYRQALPDDEELMEDLTNKSCSLKHAKQTARYLNQSNAYDTSQRNDSQSSRYSSQRTPSSLILKDADQTAIYNRMFEYMEEMRSEIRELHAKIDKLMVEKSSRIDQNLEVLPPNMDDFPVRSVDQLKELDEKLKDKEFAAFMVRYLHNVGCGKSETAFLLNITKRVLAQDVAVLYSRFGRKGKRPFTEFNSILNVLLAAASLRFPNCPRENLMDAFGKVLAGAGDWNGRRVRPSDISCSLQLNTE